ncbi:MAG: hypothetical protein ACI8XZ_005637 [Gammaproteobacteria bacterium]|jgi:hypothetical protein
MHNDKALIEKVYFLLAAAHGDARGSMDQARKLSERCAENGNASEQLFWTKVQEYAGEHLFADGSVL